MLKKLSHIIIFSLVISFIEIIALLLLFLFYDINYMGIKDHLDIVWIFFIAICILAFNAFVYLINAFIISRSRIKNNLTVSSMFGKNVEYSLEFSGLGIIAVNDSNQILWVNQVINTTDNSLLDKNILDVFPTLRNIQGADNSDYKAVVKLKDKIFNVSFLRSANIYLFKDTTEYDNQIEYSKQQQMVLGIIQIDNLSEVAGADNTDDNDIIASARTKINEYFRKKSVLLKRFKFDSYFMICNYNSLVMLEDDLFSILDDIRTVKNDEGFPLTISIGIAHDYDGPQRLNERALEALEMAISRGGDQVVIDKRDSDLKFFGGKTEAIEKKNKIKVRLQSNSLVATLKNVRVHDEVFIMGHSNADMDAIGSCLGILAICESLGVKAHVVFDLKSVETKTKTATAASFNKEEFDQKFITSREAIDRVKNNTILVCVDFSARRQAMSVELLDKCSKIILIDHHRTSEDKIDHVIFNYVDPSASSASELITELIYYAPLNPAIVVPPKYASIILSGIYLDTSFFRSQTTGSRTFEACMILRRFGADNVLADDFLKDSYEEKELTNSILQTMKIPYSGIAYCIVEEEIVERQVLAKVSDEVLRIKGMSACFTVGKLSPNTIGISARSDGSVNVQIIMEGLGGGGHFSKSAAQLENYTVNQVVELLLDELKDKLEQAKNTIE